MKRFFTDLKKYFSYSVYSAKSSLKAEVAGSYLNWLWWIFNPLCLMIIYSLVFGYIFDGREPNFPIFIFVGLTVWDYFNRTLTSSIKIVKNNKAIVTKVYLPKFILVLEKMIVNFIKMLFSIGVIIVMMIIFRVHISAIILWEIPILAVCTLFIFGISTIIMHFGVFVEDLFNIVKIILRFAYYLTGIFFSIPNRIPEPLCGYVLHLNPMAYFINETRNVVVYNTAPELKWLLIWFVVSLLLCIFGVHKVYKFENSYAKVI